ncbi:nucleotide-binding protein [Cyclobacterium salsum]|uniref:nucleotide-binding protein n=1 Tax=Cyclobacterium salsum TaxID=2666329 RepID=UPI0013907E14|nr:nucleotide-binding protein [Cyclobacterium salsum]
MKIKIFYSWQTTTNTKYNKNFISDCIEGALKKIKQEPDFKRIEFEVTDAVRSESGQVAIADTIIEKIISNSDIFIADLTIVNYDFPDAIPDDYKEILRKSLKPTPNPNVMIEYGAALKSLGKISIISILNNYYSGSPKEKNNAEIIPFDLRHDRFPTEYNFSSQNEAQKAEIKKMLVNGLMNALKPTIQNVLETKKSKYRPFVGWNEWNELINNPQSDKFITNEKIQKVQNSILTASISPSVIRLLGLSGLGKTRILLETFRPKENDTDSLITANRILYVNCNDYQNHINFSEIISKIKGEKKDAILIVDNCDISTHKLIVRNLQGLSLVTIDSNPEENSNTEGTSYIVIGKNELSDIVTQIVDNNFQNVGEGNIDRIKDFSQGIPFMAVLLGESVKNGEQFIGKLDDKDLLDKLLGAKGKEDKHRTILKSCSIFNYFGFYDELSSQTEFIAKSTNITSLNGDENVKVNDFYESCNYYLKREIFEKRGRYIGMRPFPLAMSLAQEWLDPLTPQRLIAVINEIAGLQEPDRTSLSKAFAEQMKYLGYNDKAVQIVEKIVGPGSPFDDAEVLNTELGSRLFRSFVEVNPIAVSQNFKRQFLNKSKEELLKIEAGRRNIVWTLEKLCFDKRTFYDSAKVLLGFAIAENETWANNATSQFLHLFNVHLSGTEADLSERWKIIEWLLNKEDKANYDFAIRAMKIGLNFGHASRMGGAEQQGSRRLVDNNPSWKEIDEYWGNILNKLLEIIKSKNEYAELASEAISNSIGTMFHIGFGKLILPYLKEISELKNKDWDSGLKGLKFARKYEKHCIPEEQLEEINSLIDLLTKTDFPTKYLTLSSSYHLDNDETYSSEKVIEAIINLADEYISSEISWEETFPAFYKNQQVFSFHFGNRLSELLIDDKTIFNRFIDYSLEVISQIPKEERNFTVLGGFISNTSDEIKKEFYLKLFQSSEFSSQLFYFLSIDKSGKEYFDLLFQLIDKKGSDVNSFYAFTYNAALSQLTFEELNSFSEKLFTYGDEGYAVVFDLFADLSYGDEAKKKLLKPIYKKCIVNLGFNRKFRRQLDDFKWTETISFILSDETEVDFAIFINKSVIESITWENSYHLDHYIQRVYEILLKVHFNAIWPDLSNALLSSEETYIRFYGLKHILGSRIGGVGSSVGVLFDGDIDSIFNWCADNKPLAPSRLAELTPIFDNNNTDYAKWHPIAFRLIDEYGDIKEVLSNLSSNMGTYSWTGSVVPFLESKKELFKQLTNHKTDLVKEWATSYISYLDKDIESEKNRDEEHFI